MSTIVTKTVQLEQKLDRHDTEDVQLHPNEEVNAQRNFAVRFVLAFFHLFFSRKFVVHRIFGLLYIIQFFAAWHLFANNYDQFEKSLLITTLPFTGIIQSFTARYYFTFLPKKKTDPGYYGDQGTITYPFVLENGFYSMICAFQWYYYNPTYTPWFRQFWPVEALWVFLPYALIRPLFPKTSFRDGLRNDKSKSNDFAKTFYFYATWLTKIFYVWAKHYLGFFLNYLMFIEAVTPEIRMHVFGNLLAGSFATTFSMFLHTLRFKNYLSGPVSFSIYVASYLATFYSYIQIFHVFFEYPFLFWITFAGAILNVYNFRYHDVYQVILCAAAYSGYLHN